MNKEYKIKLDLNKKLYNKKMTFNQFDENVNDFYIEVTKNNEVVKGLDKSIVTLVTIKPNNTVDAQFIEAKEGQIYADLKPSMCDIVGNYQAKAMIVLEGEIVTTDTINYSVSEDKIISRLNDDVVSDERFPLFTDALSRLSTIEISEEERIINEAERIIAEENRKIEEAKRVEAELTRVHEEADRAKYDATRESNENIRKSNEATRLANETNRIDEEAKRVEEENKRKLAEEERNANYNFMTEDEERRRLEANAHKEAETLRVQAETNRANEEAKRRTTENARVSAENTRVSNENTRKSNETTRQNNETQRVNAETQRQSRYNSFIASAESNANNFEDYVKNAKANEEERKSNELDRKAQENRRASNETERISKENSRKANEATRQNNETSRQNVFTAKVDEVNNKIYEIDKAKSDMTNTISNKVKDIDTRFNNLTSKQQQDSEVIDARTDFKGNVFDSLKERIDHTDKLLRDNTVATVVTESGFTTVEETSNGYFEDVKLEGKTLVNLCLSKYNPYVNGSKTEGLIKINNLTLDIGKTYTIYIPNIVNNFRLRDVRSSGIVELTSLITNTNIITFNIDANIEALTLYLFNGGGILTNEVLNNLNIIILEGDHTQNPPSYFEGLMSAGQDVDEVSVESVNSDETQSNKKPLLYYNPTTETWEKPILREWDSIEKHADGKYYYHQRSGEVVLNGDVIIESGYVGGDTNTVKCTIKVNNAGYYPGVNVDSRLISDRLTPLSHNQWANTDSVSICINQSGNLGIRIPKPTEVSVSAVKNHLSSNPVTVVYQLAQEKVYECTNIDLITYENETNYIVNTGAISPKSTLKVHSNISNVVKILQEKVSLLESNVKAGQEVQDMMILESDLRILDMELALMEHMPIKLNLANEGVLRSATYFNFIKNHIVNETYDKGYMENVMNKYLATNRLTQEEYDELYKMLYPPKYDIELPIEE